MSLAFEARQPTRDEQLAADKTFALGKRAAAGQKPGMALAAGTTRILTITALDKNAGTVTTRDSAGHMSTFQAKYPQNLSYVSVGDPVVVTVTEAFAANVKKVS